MFRWMQSNCLFIVKLKLFLIFVTCLVNTINAEKVIKLTEANFNELTARHDVIFINFYADWCRFSQMLSPVYEEAYEKILAEFSPQQILFAKVDCDVETSLASRFHITKYPTLKLTVNGKLLKREFRGQRSVTGIHEYIREQLKDPTHTIDTADKVDTMEEKKGAIVAYYREAPQSAANYNLFRKVAFDLKDDCRFYWVTGEALTRSPFPDHDGILTFNPPRSRISKTDMIFTGSMHSYDEISTWATEKCIPLVREITFENAEELTEENLPFLILFHASDDTKSVEIYTKVVREQLLQESSSINFLTADGKQFAHPLHHLGKDLKDLPLIAIDSFRHMYLFPDFKDIAVPGKLKQFIADLHSGKLHREFHFGPDPTPREVPASKQQIITQPPESTFKKLAPSSNRYTLLRDEL